MENGYPGSRYVLIDGVRTHYFDLGEGPPLVLLHGGEFGGRAENSWGGNMAALARHYRVVAPDWLGFGRTDKLHDFVSPRGRMVDHMARFLEIMDLQEAHVMGNSMGASLPAWQVAAQDNRFRPASMIMVSGGGFLPDNEHRRALLGYDCTRESMVRALKAVFSDSKWWTDETYLRQRYEWSVEPGVWESWAAARLRAPHLAPRQEFGQPDATHYENISCPTLIIAGEEDKVRQPGYADELLRRIPKAELVMFKRTGHCANIERAPQLNEIVLDFLDRVTGRKTASVPVRREIEPAPSD